MIKIGQILDALDKKGYIYEFYGNKDETVDGFSSLGQYRVGTLTWVRDRKILLRADVEDVSCAIIQKGVEFYANNQIVSENPKEVFFYVLQTFWGKDKPVSGIGGGTYVSGDTVLSRNVVIGHNCTLDGHIDIGEGTLIGNNVTIVNNVKIGRDCIIHSGTVIGKDGFGYSFDENNIPQKVEHFGGVAIGDRVEIGVNTCIDRGTIDNTVIGDDTKIDGLVHVGHNVNIGSGVLIVSHSFICGSAKIGDRSYLAPGSSVKEQVEIGRNTFVGLGTTVNKNIGDNIMLFGIPKEKEVYNINYRRFL